MHRAGHVFESWSRIGRIPLIAHLTPQLPKVRQHRQKNWTIFRLTAFTIPKLGAFPMLMLIVVLVHLLEIFYCKTFLLRHVQNLDFCFPVLVFLLKTMGFLRFLLQDRQFLNQLNTILLLKRILLPKWEKSSAERMSLSFQR